jgi:hypothetical protein
MGILLGASWVPSIVVGFPFFISHLDNCTGLGIAAESRTVI